MDIMQFLFFLLVFIPSSIIHEYAHGWAADHLGDPTPRMMGRLTINPKAHIDLWGTLLLPLFMMILTQGRFMFAYAKPVPFNPLNLKWQKWGSAAVAVAGPVTNLALALSLGLVVRLLPWGNFTSFVSLIVYANVLLAVFNLIPIPPLDGSKILFAILPAKYHDLKVWLEHYGMWLLLGLMVLGFQWLMPLVWLITGWMLGS